MWKASKVNIHHVTAKKIRTWAAFGSKRPKMALSSKLDHFSKWQWQQKSCQTRPRSHWGVWEPSEVNIDHVTAKKKSVLGYFGLEKGSRRAREGLKMAILRPLWVVCLRTHERQSRLDWLATLLSVVLVGWIWILNVNGSIFQIWNRFFGAKITWKWPFWGCCRSFF